MRRRARSLGLVCGLGLAVLFAAAPARAATHRLTNIHGTSCMTSDPATQPALYSNTGMMVKIPVTPNPPPVSVACSVPWSQDFSVTTTLQKIVVTLDWTAVPVSGGTSFNPTCFFEMLTNTSSGAVFVMLTTINNAGTDHPEYVFATPTGAILPAYGTVIGSGLYCTDVPVGVGILGTTIDACFASPLLGGC